MKLIIILICLGLERYLQIGGSIKRFHWFESYVKMLRGWIKQETVWKEWLGLAVVILPILIVLAIVYYAVAGMFYSVIGFFLSVLILLYCLGPDDLYHQLQSYFASVEGEQNEQQQSFLKRFLPGKPPEDPHAASRAVTEQIFVQANEHFFGVIFWFIVLGPLGAVLYRLTVLVHRQGQCESLQSMQPQAALLQSVLDWVPVRVAGLVYALVGNFGSTFGYWLKHAWKGFAATSLIITECSLAALGVSKTGKTADVKENQLALDLLDRALIVVLVIIAIFTLGAWIY